MKRFTDTEKWADPWYLKLSPEAKCFWNYIIDRADCAGVWKPAFDLASFQIGVQLDYDQILKEMEKRIKILPNGNWWIRKFVSFQYGKLSKDCRPHSKVIETLACHGIDLEEVSNTVSDTLAGYPTGRGKGRSQGKG
jgi:hypothetical protein